MAGKQVNNLAGRKSDRGRRPEKEWQKIVFNQGTTAKIPLLLGFQYSCATAYVSPLVTLHLNFTFQIHH